MRTSREMRLYPVNADAVAARVVAAGLDVAPTRITWERLARAVVLLAAGDGRQAFHAMAAVWPDYDRRDSERCYDRAQRCGGDRGDAIWLYFLLKKRLHIDIFSPPYRCGGREIAAPSIKHKNMEHPIKQRKILFGEIRPLLLGDNNCYGLSQLTDLLLKIFPQGEVIEAVNRYHVGFRSLTTGVPNDEVIFYQVNEKNEIVNGKAIKYAFGGHRDKKIPPRLLYKGNGMCLFGEHLLANNDMKVGLVESEKSALIMSIARPELLWVATGSLNNYSEKLLAPLRERLVVAFPDLDLKRGKRTGYSVTCEQWIDKSIVLNRRGFNIIVDKSLEELANYPMRAAKMDIADVAIENAAEKARQRLIHPKNNDHGSA